MSRQQICKVVPDCFVIAADVPCCQCASNLHGKSRLGQCPECGMENATSLKLAIVRTDDPTPMRKLALGLDILV